MWNDSFRSLENDRGWFGCFIINLSFYLWRSSWFTVSFLCPWKTDPCFFIGYLSCDLCLHTKSLWHIPSWCFLYLVMLLEINTESNNRCFSVPKICLWEPFLQISDKQSTAQFLFLLVHFFAICSSASSQNNTLVSYLS